MSTTWQRRGVRDDLESVAVREPVALLSLFVGGPAEMTRYAAGATIQTDDRIALEFSGPFAIFSGTSTNNAVTLRALLDDASSRRPAAIERALTGATAAQWRDRGAMMIAADAFDSAIVQPARPTQWGGYSGYFADPEGYLWEVATGATQLPFAE